MHDVIPGMTTIGYPVLCSSPAVSHCITLVLFAGDVPHPLDDQLKDALLESLTTLPEGGLKDELSKNIDVYFRKLKR